MKMFRKTFCSASALLLAAAALTAGDLTVDGLVESIGLGFKFPDGSVQTSAAGHYAKLITVAKSGGQFTTIQGALDSITDAPANRYLIQVGPGVFTERVTMKAGVDIQGSGALTTKITFGGSVQADTGTVVGATDAELRFLTVENVSAPGSHAIAIYNDGAAPRLTHVQAIAFGGSKGYGIYNKNAPPPMSYVFASATLAGQENYGVYNETTNLSTPSSPDMYRVVILMGALLPPAADSYWGVYNKGGSAPKILDSDITVLGGINAYGVYNDVGSPAALKTVTIRVGDATTQNTGVYSGNNSITVLQNCDVRSIKGLGTSSTAYGMENSTSHPEVHHSRIEGETSPIQGSDPKVAFSQLAGGTKATFLHSSCLGAYDESFAALNDQCS